MNSVNRFVKGIVSDLNPIDIDNQSWVFPTVNVRITNSGDMIVAKPLDGNRELFSIPGNVRVIGAKEYADVLYLVLYNDDNNYVEVGSYPYVGNISDGFIYNYGPLQFVKNNSSGFTQYNFGDKLGYDGKTKIDLKFYNSYDGTVDIYLNDTKNPTYVINNCFNSDGEFIDRSINFDSLPKKIFLINGTEKPGIVDSVEIQDGGNLRPGNYQFFLRYVSESYDKTLFIFQSDIVSLTTGTNNKRFGKFKSKDGVLSKTINKVILSLSNLDDNYKYIQVGYTIYTGNAGDEAIIESYLINQYYTFEETKDIVITGREKLIDLTLDEIAAISSTDIICKAQVIFNSRYIGANWKSEINNKNLVDLSLNAFIESTTTKLVSSDPYGLGFMNREIYPFGIVYTFKNGKESDVYPIKINNDVDNYKDGLYKIFSEDQGYHNHYGININFSQLKNEISNNPLYDNISGFYIVRGDRIKNILSTGIVVPVFDGVKMKDDAGYFYNKELSATEGYSIPNTFFENKYPTQDVTTGDKAGFGVREIRCSDSANRKLAFFSPETLFDNQSNISYLNGDELYYQLLEDSLFKTVKSANNNSLQYKGIEQTDKTFALPNNIDLRHANMYFVRKGNKTSNGQFSGFIPDSYKDDSAIKSYELEGGGWWRALRSSLFNNYIGFETDKDNVNYIGLGDPLFEYNTDIVFSGVNKTETINVNNVEIDDGVTSKVTPFKITLTGVTGESILSVIVNIDAIDEISNVVDSREVHFSYSESGEYVEQITLDSWREDVGDYGYETRLIKERVSSIVLSGKTFTGTVDSFSFYALLDDGNIPVFNFKAKLARIFNYKNSDEYEKSAHNNFQINSTFYFKISQFIPIDTEDSNVVLYNGDVYTGDFYMRGHRWFGAKQLYAYGGSDESQIYQHGSYFKFKVQTDINIHARSIQHTNEEMKGQGNYSFLPYEMDRENEWTVVSSLEKDMHESSILNPGFSKNDSVKRYIGYDDISPERTNEFKTRLRVSDKAVVGSFYNSFKTFRASQYTDYDEQYGPIVSIHNLRGQLISIQFDAINVIYTKETSSKEFDIVLGSSDKYFYEKAYIKARYGAQKRSHVYETNDYIYGVDVSNLKFYRIATGSSPEGKQLIQVEDLTETKRNTKYLINFLDAIKDSLIDLNIGYDRKNREVLFTFSYPSDIIIEDNSFNGESNINSPNSIKKTTIIFSEKIQGFTGLYIMPADLYTEYDNKLVSFNGSKAYIHDDSGDPLTIYGIEYSMILSYIINNSGKEASPLVKKFFQSIKLRSPKAKLKSIKFSTDVQQGELVPFYDENRFWLQPEYNEYHWEIPIPINKEKNDIFGEGSQLKGEWLKVTLEYKGKEEFYVVYATALFNPINY